MRRPVMFLPKGVKREAAGVALSTRPETPKPKDAAPGRGSTRMDNSRLTKASLGARRRKGRAANAQAKVSRRRNRAR